MNRRKTRRCNLIQNNLKYISNSTQLSIIANVNRGISKKRIIEEYNITLYTLNIIIEKFFEKLTNPSVIEKNKIFQPTIFCEDEDEKSDESAFFLCELDDTHTSEDNDVFFYTSSEEEEEEEEEEDEEDERRACMAEYLQNERELINLMMANNSLLEKYLKKRLGLINNFLNNDEDHNHNNTFDVTSDNLSLEENRCVETLSNM